LIARYQKEGQVQERSYQRNRFARRYTAADLELLGAVDEAHETLSGPATQKILYREYYEYGDACYQRLATISVPHIYNLRKSSAYRRGESGIRRPGRCRWPLASGGNRARMVGPDTCG